MSWLPLLCSGCSGPGRLNARHETQVATLRPDTHCVKYQLFIQLKLEVLLYEAHVPSGVAGQLLWGRHGSGGAPPPHGFLSRLPQPPSHPAACTLEKQQPLLSPRSCVQLVLGGAGGPEIVITRTEYPAPTSPT